VRLLITRPAEDAEGLAAQLAERGIESLVAPMMAVADVPGPNPDLAGVQALMITSVNGIRAFARRSPVRGVRVMAVGDASARTARSLGFENVESAAGDVEALATLAAARLEPVAGPLLHVAGSHVAGDLASGLKGLGFQVRSQVLYEARAIDALDRETTEALQTGALDGVLLFSPRTAAIFADRIAAAGLAGTLGAMTAYCLSPAVKEKAELHAWRRIVVASEPTQEALLAAVSA